MKKILITSLALVAILFFVTGCKKPVDPEPPIGEPTAPVVQTTSALATSATTALISGFISNEGNSPIIAAGVCLSFSNAIPSVENDVVMSNVKIGGFSCLVVGLKPSTKYITRTYASNSEGIGYGDTISFTTGSTPPPVITIPTVKTISVYDITSNSALSAGQITADGGGAILEAGFCWASDRTPTIDDFKSSNTHNIGVFDGKLSNLALLTKYNVRAYAKNSAGTAYGEAVALTTYDSVVDKDGNIYLGVTIGNQVWLTSNLKATHFRNGDPVPNIKDNEAWTQTNGPAYCWYNNDISHKAKVGALYNWWVANDSRNICPPGYHIPSKSEVQELGEYFGLNQTMTDQGEIYAYCYNGGEALQGLELWDPDYGSATNSTGFNALPGGFRFHSNGQYLNEFGTAGWWLSTEYDSGSAWNFYLPNSSPDHLTFILTGKFYYKKYGENIRCIKD